MLKIIGKGFLGVFLFIYAIVALSQKDNDSFINENLEYLSNNGYASIAASFNALAIDPAVVATLAQVLRWYHTSIKIIKSLLKSASGKYKALLSSSKAQTTSFLSSLNVVFENKTNQNSNNRNRSIKYKNHNFVVGNIAATGCLRESHEWVVNELVSKKEPLIKGVLDNLSNDILKDDTDKTYNNVNKGLSGESSLLFLNQLYTEDSLDRLQASINHFANPDAFKKSHGNSMKTNNGEYYFDIERYKLMVMLVHKTILKLYANNLVLDSDVSSNIFDKRLYVSSIANNKNLSLQVKDEAGNYKEMAETLSNIYMSNKGSEDSMVSLLSVIASSLIREERK